MRTLASRTGDISERIRQRLASMELRDQIDHVFVSLQFQDRLSQMLGGIRDDMARFTDWMATSQPATLVEATRWLEALEQTYTMEEQRAHHHGTVEVRRSAGVEFF